MTIAETVNVTGFWPTITAIFGVLALISALGFIFIAIISWWYDRHDPMNIGPCEPKTDTVYYHKVTNRKSPTFSNSTDSYGGRMEMLLDKKYVVKVGEMYFAGIIDLAPLGMDCSMPESAAFTKDIYQAHKFDETLPAIKLAKRFGGGIMEVSTVVRDCEAYNV